MYFWEMLTYVLRTRLWYGIKNENYVLEIVQIYFLQD